MARVNSAGPGHINGDPDIYGCVEGLMFHMEVKQPKGLLKPMQEYQLGLWANAGAKVYVVRSLREAKAAYEDARAYAMR